MLLPALPAGAAMPVVSSAAIAGSGGGADALMGIGQDDSGNIYVAGHLTQTGTGKDIWVGKYSPELVKLTTYTFDKAGFDDAAWALVVDTVTVGGVFVAGYVSSAAATSGRDIWLARFDDSLVLIASATVNGSADDWDEARGLRVYDGALYVVGHSSVTGGRAVWLGGFSLETLAMVATATVVQYGALAYDVMPVASGNVFVAGSVAPDAGSPGAAWLGQFDENLVLIGSATINGPSAGADEFRRLAADGDGGVVAVGFLNTATGASRYMRHFDASLAALSSAAFTGSGGAGEYLSDILKLADGTLFVSGSASEAPGAGGVNGLLAELSDEFVTVSSTTVRSAGTGEDHVYSFMLGANEDVYAVGWAAGSDQDALLARFSTLLPNPAYPGCATTENVGAQYRHETIQEAVGALPATLTGPSCVVIRDGATYLEQVRVSGFANAGSSITILADPGSGLTPVVSPPAASTAAFLIANSSVSLHGLKVIVSQNVPYGVWASSAYVHLSSVSVSTSGGNGIYAAGVRLGSWSSVSHSTVAVWNAHGLWLDGSRGSVVTRSTASSQGSFNAYPLFFNGAASNTVTESYISDPSGYGAVLDLGSDYNTISLTTMTSRQSSLLLDESAYNTITRSCMYAEGSDDSGAARITGGAHHNTISQSLLLGRANNAALGVSGSDYNTITQSFLIGQANGGVELGNARYTTISLSTITADNTSASALVIAGGSSSNTISQTYLANATGQGVLIDEGSVYNTLSEAAVHSSLTGLSIASGSYNTVTLSRLSSQTGMAAHLGAGAVRNTIDQSTITSRAAGAPALYLLAAASNTVQGSYIQGSTAAVVSGSTGTSFDTSVLVATSPFGGALSLRGGSVNLSVTGSIFRGGPSGRGLVLEPGNSGTVSIGSVTAAGSAKGVELSTQAAGFVLSVNSLFFEGLAAGATAVDFAGGTFVATITAASFDASAAVNVNASALNAASRVTMRLSSGARTGPIYENDPAAVVDWPGAAPSPSTPTALAASGIGLGWATLGWAAAGNLPGTVYELQRSSGTGYGLRIATTALTYFDLPLAPASTYYYRVRAINDDLVASAYASSITAVTPPVTVYPALSSVTPSSAIAGGNVPTAITGSGFDGSAALSLEKRSVGQGVWTATGSFSQPRFQGTLNKLRDGRVLLAGGLVEGVGTGRAEADLFDPAAGAWTATAPMRQGRYEFASVMLADGRVLVAGGVGPGAIVASAEIYDPALSTWTFIAPMSSVRQGPELALLPDGRVLAAGGWNGSIVLGSAEIYDPATNAWTAAPAMSAGRYLPAVTTLGDGRILITGGSGVATAEIYDPAGGAWSTAGTMSAQRYYHQTAVLPGGKVLVAGGSGSGGPTNTADVYDPATNGWTATSTMAAARFAHALVSVNGSPIVIGGQNTLALSSTEIYDPALNAWRAGPALAVGTRTYPRAVLLDDGQVLVAGGRQGMGGGTTLNTAQVLAMPSTQITATGVVVGDAQNVSGTFDLTAAATGYWDAVVRQSGGRTGRLDGGFLAYFPSPPTAPSGFAGVAQSTGSIRWSWTDESINETGFRVMSGAVNLSGDLPAGTTSWLQAGLSTATSYGPYFARAFNLGGAQDSATATRATLAAVPSVPAASGVGLGGAMLVWSAGGNPGGTVFQLERSSGAGYGLRIATTSLSYFDLPLSPASTYYYRARALNADLVASAYTSSLTVVTPPVPVHLAVASITPSSATVDTSVPAALTGTGFDGSAALSIEKRSSDQGVWTATGAFTQPRMLGEIARLNDGRVLLAGGL
ncbi:MAG: right-handed parallel beta-helix repeat-containing protein, partial [Elusimicrobia bacterium]|nr:right-handed parallel beta-helix repeat-containing protein [Elusimicrobiota bacterium]